MPVSYILPPVVVVVIEVSDSRQIKGGDHLRCFGIPSIWYSDLLNDFERVLD